MISNTTYLAAGLFMVALANTKGEYRLLFNALAIIGFLALLSGIGFFKVL